MNASPWLLECVFSFETLQRLALEVSLDFFSLFYFFLVFGLWTGEPWRLGTALATTVWSYSSFCIFFWRWSLSCGKGHIPHTDFLLIPSPFLYLFTTYS